tara:strand:- start:192 stop:356 length:165 start_codon:yes stop_codon:yes gene_type:complete
MSPFSIRYVEVSFCFGFGEGRKGRKGSWREQEERMGWVEKRMKCEEEGGGGRGH